MVNEKRQGSNIARQAGLEKATGEIVAFLDADSVPPPDWLQKIGQDLADDKFAAVSGPPDFGFTGYKKSLNFFYTNYILTNAPIFFN